MANTNFQGGFNDIGEVDLIIQTPLGDLQAHNLGPSDVVILASPGNGGDVMNVFEGSTGQLVANRSYKVKNWSVTVRFLRHSLDYCRGTYLIQEILNGNVTTVGIQLTNKNFGVPDEKGAIPSDRYEKLEAPQAFLVNFAGLEMGAGASGDFEMTFKCSNAEFTSGEYRAWGSNYATNAFPDNKTEVTPTEKPDVYAGATYA
jgi:hypothetical protein